MTVPRHHRGETVECASCGWQGGRNETDAGHCPNCGDECYDLSEIYTEDGEAKDEAPNAQGKPTAANEPNEGDNT